MSWGTRIAILYGSFVLLIAAMIYRTTKENTDLVAADYYQQELKYQEEIDGQENLINAGGVPAISLDAQYISIQLPEAAAQSPSGTVVFYRPDNAKLDQKYDLRAASSQYAASGFTSGLYQVQISWTSTGEKYYHETSIYIP